jgi:signal peptide peptidase SppA
MENSTFLNSHWAITPEAFAKFASYDLDKMVIPDSAIASESAEDDSYKGRMARFMRQFEESISVNESGVASLSICGPIMPNPDAADRYFFEACDSVRVANLIRSAADDQSIKSLVLYINSPGGMVVGTPEVGNAIRAFNDSGKVSIAFADTLMASAAYWIGSQASAVFTTESALLGSIGVIRPHVDASKMREQMGIKIDVFRGGRHKVAGAYNTAMTEEQREHIQAGVDEVHEQFKATVRSGRGKDIKDDDMQGQVFYGSKAVEKGLANGVVDNIDAIYGTDHAGFKKAASSRKGMKAESTDVDNFQPAMSNPTEPQMVDKTELETALAQVTDLQGQVESANERISTLTVERDAANDNAEVLTASNAEQATKITALESDVADLKADFDAKVLAKADELAEAKAASIAASAGTDPAAISDDSAASEAEKDAAFAGMSQAQLWEEFNKIKATDTDAARVFYLKHIYR